jgi:nucleoside-diphosphate-sugar epimerase
MSNLIIGDTSQLSYYFPKDYERISSRNIDFAKICKNKYNKIYILFAEQRTYLNESEYFFNEINVTYTLLVIDKIKDYCDHVVIYSTSELWNDYEGEVSINMDYKYNYSPYIKSKQILCEYIKSNKDKYSNINIIYPFNFNSPHRKGGFLFAKIFDSIMNRKNITTGDLNFNRDLIHPSIIVENSINKNQDQLIGCGDLINVENFIKDLFFIDNLNYKDYISSDKINNLNNKRKEYFSKEKYSSYGNLLKLTYNDLR